jgi:hypothetical protein
VAICHRVRPATREPVVTSLMPRFHGWVPPKYPFWWKRMIWREQNKLFLLATGLVAAYLWHQRRSGSRPRPAEDPIPSWTKQLLVLCGGLLTFIAVITFFFPGMDIIG